LNISETVQDRDIVTMEGTYTRLTQRCNLE